MIKNIVKRDGRVVPFSAQRLNNWAVWAVENLNGLVDWQSVVMKTVSKLPETCKSSELQNALIKTCLEHETWGHQRMAGKLYASVTYREIYGKYQIPTVKALHERMRRDGYLIDMGYTDEEYEKIEKIIQHDRDFRYPHFQLFQIRNKYGVKDRVNRKEYESPQFTYMRMAMALAAQMPKERRMHDLKMWYNHFSTGRLSPPTPNYVNLGTKLNSYASCCIIKTDDNEPSLAAGDHIAYRMTAASAGIGAFYDTRSEGEPVRGGMIKHAGKRPYYAAFGKAIRANMQNGRAGAGAMYFTCYDPEIMMLMKLKNPLSVNERRNRDMDYGMIHNKFFARKAAKNEDYFLFNSYTAPDLHAAIWDPDETVFERLYAKYEADESFPKSYLNARDVLRSWLSESFTTGHAHFFMADESNRHTPFKDTIYSSNLCVSGDTLLLTREGEFLIEDLVGQQVEVWNGREWSPTQVVKTGENQELWNVWLSDGKSLTCTAYHKWYIETDRGAVMMRTHRLKPGMYLESFELPDGAYVSDVTIEAIEPKRLVGDTYCVNEPKRNKAVFNGILTGNCNEIYLPTNGYKNTAQLYAETDHGYVHLKAKPTELDDVTTMTLMTSDVIDNHSQDQSFTTADGLNVGDVFSFHGSAQQYEVLSVEAKVQEPEVALCSLAALIPSNINNDEEYASAAYYALLMIDCTIHMSSYALPHVGYTAKRRLSAGVGLMDIAHLFAKKGIAFDSKEALDETHRIAERHMYFLIEASLKLGQEFGNAPWIHRTKWPSGWLPIDTYNRSVDRLTKEPLRYDWESLRQRIIENKGIRNSVVGAIMPGESSSKAMGVANAIYPVRSTELSKTDNELASYWVAPNAERLNQRYQSAWDVPMEAYVDYYAIYQKFLDQGGSWDLFRKIEHGSRVESDEVLRVFFRMHEMGLKGRYYQNSDTSAPLNFHHISDDITVTMDEVVECVRNRYKVEPNTTVLSMYVDIAMQNDPTRLWTADAVVDVIMGILDVGDLTTESEGCAGGGCKL